MSFATLALICLVALVGPLFAVPRHGGLPVVIGELLVGLVLGQTGLQALDATNETFSFMAQIGFALVMFIAGTNVPLRNPAMRAGLRWGVARALLAGALAVPVGLGLAALFGTGHGALYAVLLASSSAGLVMPALADEQIAGRHGVEMQVQLAVADAACIILLPLAMQPAKVGHAAFGAAVVLAGAGLCYLALSRAGRSGRQRRLHKVSEQHQFAAELRITLVLLFGLAAVAVYLQVTIMLAGFALGVAVSAVGEPRRVAHQLFALSEGFFAPLFFVWLGVSLDLRQLATNPQSLLLGLALGVGAVAVHAAPILTRQPWPIALVTAAQLGVPIGAVTLGKALDVFQPGEATALLIGSLVTIGVVAMAAGGVRKVLAAEVDASLPDGSPPRRAGAEGAAASGRSDPS